MVEELEPGVEVFEAGDLKTTLDVLEEHPDMDLLILDLVMPDMDGGAGVSRLRKLAPAVPLVILSAYERPSDAREAFGMGAAGYIPKSSPKQVIMRALQLVLSGGSYFPPELLSGEEDSFAAPAQPALPPGMSETAGGGNRSAVLTKRQRDVLDLMAQGRSNREIAERLGLAEGTVKVHVAAVLRALNVSNRTQAVLVSGRFKR